MSRACKQEKSSRVDVGSRDMIGQPGNIRVLACFLRLNGHSLWSPSSGINGTLVAYVSEPSFRSTTSDWLRGKEGFQADDSQLNLDVQHSFRACDSTLSLQLVLLKESLFSSSTVPLAAPVYQLELRF